MSTENELRDPIEAAALAVWKRRHPSGRVALPDGGLLRDAVYDDVRATIKAYGDTHADFVHKVREISTDKTHQYRRRLLDIVALCDDELAMVKP